MKMDIPAMSFHSKLSKLCLRTNTVAINAGEGGHRLFQSSIFVLKNTSAEWLLDAICLHVFFVANGGVRKFDSVHSRMK